MRLIDADALPAETAWEDDDGRPMQYVLLADIDAAPTVDAEVVRHGRWEHKDNSGRCIRIGDYEEWYECIGCEGSADHISDFCPNCGAKMDKEDT